MKAEILKVAQDLEKGTIDSDKARSLLLGLFGVSGSFPSKDEAVNVGFKKAISADYNFRKVCRDADHDLYYSGWMDCYDWLLGNDR